MSRIQLLDPNKKGREADALETRLRQLVIGQDDAINKIVEAYQGFRTGMSPGGRPVGNFLFLGPTGSGKTRVVEATAEALLNHPGGVVKIDCAEYQHSHEIAKLIGSPPGYIGHRETHALLSQEALNQHHTEELKLSFLLFDEIEKASDSLWNLLLDHERANQAQVAIDAHAQPLGQVLARDRSGRHAHHGPAGRGAATAAMVP